VYDFVTNKKAKLLEHLAQSVAYYLLSFDPRIQKVEVLLQKPSAIPLASFASVQILRSRSDFPELVQGIGLHNLPLTFSHKHSDFRRT
jgi:hypothetical protein